MTPALRDLVKRFHGTGTLRSIHLRPARDVATLDVERAEAVAGRGLVGDHSGMRAPRSADGGRRQVTLMQAEHLPLVAAWTGHASIAPGLVRRNLVVSGINLVALRSPFADQCFRVRVGDDVVLLVTGDCAPCSKMDRVLGAGAYNAMRGHGGVTARVIEGGVLRVGDTVRVEVDAASG